MIFLYGWGPMFGERGPSPFVLKTEMQLQMLGLSFERALADLDSVPRHKAPYVLHDGHLIEDSETIRAHFEEKCGCSLDAPLGPTQRSQAWALQRMLDGRLYFIMLMERWLEGNNFERGPITFFNRIAEGERQGIAEAARGQLRTALHIHGIGRYSRRERMELARQDIAAVSDFIADREFLFGATPTAADASVYGHLVCAAARVFDSELPAIVEAHTNLRPYLARMEAAIPRDGEWPPLPRS